MSKKCACSCRDVRFCMLLLLWSGDVVSRSIRGWFILSLGKYTITWYGCFVRKPLSTSQLSMRWSPPNMIFYGINYIWVLQTLVPCYFLDILPLNQPLKSQPILHVSSGSVESMPSAGSRDVRLRNILSSHHVPFIKWGLAYIYICIVIPNRWERT